MMGGWGPKTAEEAREHKEKAMIHHHRTVATMPLQDKIAKLEARIAKQDCIIALLKKHLKKHGNDDLVLELLVELMEE